MKKLNSSEAIFGFLGWLTTRDEKVTFSAKHDSGIAAELANEFIKTNKLDELRPEWVDYLKHPKSKNK
jgi:hypothetical protein